VYIILGNRSQKGVYIMVSADNTAKEKNLETARIVKVKEKEKEKEKTTIRERPESNRNSQVVEDLRHFPRGTHGEACYH
jgi:hypothetical protein